MAGAAESPEAKALTERSGCGECMHAYVHDNSGLA